MEEQIQLILDKGREIADIAGQKGCELWESARLSMKISEAKAELRKDYIKLGKLAYKAIEKDSDEFISEMKRIADCIAVDKERVEFLTQALSEVKGLKICANCEEKNPEKAKYCNKCGTEI